MKVLLINSICGYGSTGKIAVDLHGKLTDNGHECRIAYGLGNSVGVDDSDTFFFGGRIDYYYHNIMSKITDRAGFYSKQQTRHLIDYIDTYKPDVIHMHNIHGYFLNIELLFDELKKIDIPVVWTIHDCWPFTGHCAHYSNNKCYKWKTQCSDCPAKNRYPRSYFLSQARRNYNDKKRIFNGVRRLHITTPSDWLNKQVSMSFLGGYPITTVNNGIDLSIFKPTKGTFRERYGINEKKMLLGVSSAWIPEKGFQDFIELSRMLGENYKIVIVGMDEPPLNLPSNMMIIPNVKDQHELAEIYSSADIYISFSVEETFGMPTVEAMACGTPVLTYDETALPEPVTNATGIVVKAHDVRSACEHIMAFPPFDKSRIINEAKKYDKNIKYEEFMNLYYSFASQ